LLPRHATGVVRPPRSPWLLSALDFFALVKLRLLLCPTRELADQVIREIRRPARSRFIPNVKVLNCAVVGVPLRPPFFAGSRAQHSFVGTRVCIPSCSKRKHGPEKAQSIRVLCASDKPIHTRDMGFAEIARHARSHTEAKRSDIAVLRNDPAIDPESVESLQRELSRYPGATSPMRYPSSRSFSSPWAEQ